MCCLRAPLFASVQVRLQDSMLVEADVNALEVTKALLLRFDDSSERCRELAVGLLLVQLQVLSCTRVQQE